MPALLLIETIILSGGRLIYLNEHIESIFEHTTSISKLKRHYLISDEPFLKEKCVRLNKGRRIGCHDILQENIICVAIVIPMPE